MEIIESISKITLGLSLSIYGAVFVFTPGLTALGWMIFLPMFLGGIGTIVTGIHQMVVTHQESLPHTTSKAA